MTCASCGATIADKAIVCYKCGTPTAIPVGAPAAARRAGGSRIWIWIAAVAAVFTAGWTVLGPLRGPSRIATIAIGVAIVIQAVVLARRGR